MDNLTHAFVGAAIAKAGAERATPLATATLVIAANATDIDVLAYARGEYFALAFRRGITHGWPAMILLPFIVTLGMLAWDRWVRRKRNPSADPARAGPLLTLSAIGVATHPTLDWMNTYGVRWGVPFDPAWSYGDALFIIDPWIWLALGGTVFLASRPTHRGTAVWLLLTAATSTLVLAAFPTTVGLVWVSVLTSLIVARVVLGAPSPGGRAGIVRAAITLTVLYVATLVALDRTGRRETAELARTRGLDVQDVMLQPLRGNPFSSDVEIKTPRGYVPGTFRWLASPRIELFPDLQVAFVEGPPDTPPELVDAVVAHAREIPRARDYLVWSRYPYVRVRSTVNGWAVRFSDARYDGTPEAGGLAGLVVDVPREEIE